jgi:hypothetical protein
VKGDRWLLTSVTEAPGRPFHFSLFTFSLCPFTVSSYSALCLARCAATFARLPQALMLHQRRR